MQSRPRILAFSGSARRESFNAKLVRIAATGAERAGAECTLIDLRDHPLPIYDADLEAAQGLPQAARELRDLFHAHGALLIASPEYNSSISALLKNTIDWVSRSPDAVQDLSGFRGKAVALLAASPGPLGGLRGLTHLRALLANLGCLVLPDLVTIRQAADAFDASGALREPRYRQRVERLGATLAATLEALQSGARRETTQ